MNPLLIPPLFEFGSKLIDKLFPDTTEADRKKVELATLIQQGELQVSMEQIKTNQIEAQHTSIFVAGWRPFIGWTCGAGLCWNFLGHPLATWAMEIWRPEFTPPALVSDNLMELTLAMLGLAGLRSWEKRNGVTR